SIVEIAMGEPLIAGGNSDGTPRPFGALPEDRGYGRLVRDTYDGQSNEREWEYECGCVYAQAPGKEYSRLCDRHKMKTPQPKQRAADKFAPVTRAPIAGEEVV